MKILIMPSWYPTKEKPLSGIFFKEQAQALARRGHDVAIAVMRSDGGKTVSCDVTTEGNFREYIFHHAPMRFHNRPADAQADAPPAFCVPANRRGRHKVVEHLIQTGRVYPFSII